MRSIFRFAGTSVARLAFCAATALGLLSTTVTASAQPVGAGTLIRNIAEVTYFDTGLGILVTLESNPVEATVAMVPAVDVTGTDALLLSRGAVDQFQFQVINTGNIAVDVTPEVVVTGTSAALLDPRLYIDENANGVIDNGEPALGASDSFAIATGARAQLIYSFRVPSAAQFGDAFSVVLSATADPIIGPDDVIIDSGETVTGQGIGTVEIISSTLEIEKFQAVQTGDDMARLRYDMRLRNNSDAPVVGYSEIDGAALRIDGTQVNGILLRDAIPLNTRFDTVTQTGGMTPLYHSRNDARHDYTTTEPGDVTEIDAVAFFRAGDFPTGFSADVSFAVTVDGALGSVEVDNTAETFVPAIGSVSPQLSNTVSIALFATQDGSLTFIDEVSGLSTTSGSLDSNLVTQLVSGGCNISAASDSVQVTLRSTQTGDVETTTARETGANTGAFQIAPLPVTEMSSPAAGDGVMASGRGDTIVASVRCGATTLTASLMIAPGNFVFDAINNEPVEGVSVVLRDADTGLEVARAETDERGYFAFGDTAAGAYIYDLEDAAAWSFPSTRLDFRGFGRIITDAATGGRIPHEGGALMASDIPVDPFYGTPIALEKTADRDRVMQGEFISYTLSLTNNMRQALGRSRDP